MLAFVTHPKPKIRRAAQHAVVAVLKGSIVVTGDTGEGDEEEEEEEQMDDGKDR